MRIQQRPSTLERGGQDWNLYSFLNTDMCKRQRERIIEADGVVSQKVMCHRCMLAECIFNRNLNLTSVMGRYFNDWVIVESNQRSKYNTQEQVKCKDKWDSAMLKKS